MKALLLVPVLGLALVALLDRDAGLGTWLELSSEYRIQAARIDRLEGEIERLRHEVEALESDPFALERAIREDLDLAKPGEVIVRLGSESSAEGRPSPRFHSNN